MSQAAPRQSGPGPRIPPVPPEDHSEEVEAFFAQVEGPGGVRGLSRLNIVRTLARHPDLAMPYWNFGMRVLRFSSVPARLRVIATLRTAWLYHCDYEWKEHVRNAPRVGITPEEIEAAKVGSTDPSWTDLERTVLRAVEQLRDETHDRRRHLGGPEWNFDQRQLMDFLFTVGSYAMLAMVANSIRIDLEA